MLREPVLAAYIYSQHICAPACAGEPRRGTPPCCRPRRQSGLLRKLQRHWKAYGCLVAAGEERVATVVSLHQDCDLATWGVDFAALQWRAGELGVSVERCPVRTVAAPFCSRAGCLGGCRRSSAASLPLVTVRCSAGRSKAHAQRCLAALCADTALFTLQADSGL